ncbi:SDR family NAD(P)-dependent oxidoreductase [Nocardia arthritidis]|uniref:SDR family NAD(P)-dependent oxidoreductase n=1 Tax=Nocardia arthritidis TaxID=228602 RepID=A0A6G9YPS2_9NOCA|nr:SDR family NAD(P)-dependent oxidoreductase [Nocardia arthritidis]QIS15016.1 SDR family NAD(P)-dependent oxidoreductase [Nocardia arthritidis]
MTKTVVISGATDGMGRAMALERLTRGDTMIAIGSNQAKGEALAVAAGSAADRLQFLRADLSSVAEVERVIAEIKATHRAVDALLLFANRVSARRMETADGYEYSFALYYLSRYLLSHKLTPLLERAARPVIVCVSGVGVTKGGINWDDPQLTQKYSAVRAQLQAGRANDLLGVYYAEKFGGTVRFVHYHPGFTRSGDLSAVNPVVRTTIRTLARCAARPVDESVRPINDFIDNPPAAPLTAIDRGRILDLSLPTLDPRNARRLASLTKDLLSTHN